MNLPHGMVKAPSRDYGITSHSYLFLVRDMETDSYRFLFGESGLYWSFDRDFSGDRNYLENFS
jgi:hypothetical protein